MEGHEKRHGEAEVTGHPDAIECGACKHPFVPEKYDGEFIVNVVRVQGDPPGTPGLAICDMCLDILKHTGHLNRDRLVIN